MRLVLAGSAVSLVAAALVACSSAPPPPAAEEGDESEVTAQPTQPSPTTPPATAAPTTQAPVSDMGDAGIGSLPPTGTVSSGPSAACNPDSIQETEGNNDPTTANVIPYQSATFCGRLEPGDVDHVSFVMPATGRVSFNFTPEVFRDTIVEASVGGTTFNPNSFPWPFAAGQTYVFKISSPGNLRPIDYRFRFDLR